MQNADRTLVEIVNHVVKSTPQLANLFLEMTAAQSEWGKRLYSSPSPDFVKHAVILRNGLADATWIETGTLHGETTEKLAVVAKSVYTIEPEPNLFQKAQLKFSENPKVNCVNGTSEEVMDAILAQLSGKVCFWLDGHYSGDGTFKGPNDTPIVNELQTIEKYMGSWEDRVIMIDDIRLFTGKVHAYSPYPTLDFLVDWVRQRGLKWKIEHDIFIAH